MLHPCEGEADEGGLYNPLLTKEMEDEVMMVDERAGEEEEEEEGEGLVPYYCNQWLKDDVCDESSAVVHQTWCKVALVVVVAVMVGGGAIEKANPHELLDLALHQQVYEGHFHW